MAAIVVGLALPAVGPVPARSALPARDGPWDAWLAGGAIGVGCLAVAAAIGVTALAVARWPSGRS